MESKIVIYVIVVYLILSVIARVKSASRNMYYDAYIDTSELGASVLMLRYGIIAYFLIRFIIAPITIWWFK